jgi:cytochrome c
MSIPEGDYERGKKLFKQRCLQCHVVDTLATKTGPTLNGLIGRKSGTVDGFDYSAANKNKVSTKFRDHLLYIIANPNCRIHRLFEITIIVSIFRV